jgi:hypothetical protein
VINVDFPVVTSTDNDGAVLAETNLARHCPFSRVGMIRPNISTIVKSMQIEAVSTIINGKKIVAIK